MIDTAVKLVVFPFLDVLLPRKCTSRDLALLMLAELPRRIGKYAPTSAKATNTTSVATLL